MTNKYARVCLDVITSEVNKVFKIEIHTETINVSSMIYIYIFQVSVCMRKKESEIKALTMVDGDFRYPSDLSF